MYSKTMLILGLVLLISCGKNGSGNDVEQLKAYERTFSNILRGSTTNFTYFSLSENDTVEVSNPKKDSGWDIGIGQRIAGSRPDGQGGMIPIIQSAIITNNGVSGNANAAGYLMTGTSFADIVEITEALEDSFKTDTMVGDILSPAIATGSGTWYNYDPTTHRLSPNPEHVILLKTADGNYAKVQVTEMYYKASLNADPDYTKFGFFSIKFVYQEDKTSNRLVPSNE